jgi:hypothetical protein
MSEERILLKFIVGPRVVKQAKGLSKLLYALSSRRHPNATFFHNLRRQQAGPVPIKAELHKELRIASVLWIFETTADPDLSVVRNALGIIALRPHRS